MTYSGFIMVGFTLMLAVTPLAAKTTAIGGARVIVNEVTGKVGDDSSALRRGDPVYENELITTGDKARAEFQFLDKTLLTLGEKSNIRLDAYVYNPRRRTGRIVINSLKGAFRFVSGSARKASYQLKTPLATIGVRGTIIDGYMSPDGQFSVFLLQQGKMTACSADACRQVNRPGFFVVVRANGTVSRPKAWKGQIPGIQFTTVFPAPGGRFYANPFSFKGQGSESAGQDTGSTGGPGGGGRGGGTTY